MKDLDFDELDRAVSSVLEAKGSEDSNTTNDTAVIPDTADQASDEATDNSSSLDSQKTLVQRRSSGRFMDVVHPSSDMKVQNKPTVSRQAADITPPGSSDSIAPIEAESIAPVESVDAVDDTHTLPDPLDFNNFSESDAEEDTTATEESHEEAAAALEQAASELHELDGLMHDQREIPPLDTPFVNDLSVEKRPLGAFSLESSDVIDTDSNEATVDETTIDDTAVADSAQNDESIDEVESEISSTDSLIDSDIDKQRQPEPDTVPEELQQDVVAIEARDIEEVVQPTASAAGSITQQYTEKTSKQSTDITPVFDTTDYHQPLKHTEKKSGWGGIILIIGFVILGVAAGAAFYFFDPFNLLP